MPRTDALLAAVDVYFRALYECDVTLLDSVFHPASTLFDVDEAVVTVDPYPAWREVVANRASPASVAQERDDEVVNVDWLSEKAAVVHVRLRVLDAIFVDQLSFVDGPDGWQIVAKVWHLESTVSPV
ncbi:nuclear transport factor 2 family protein [soil metagenome]